MEHSVCGHVFAGYGMDGGSIDLSPTPWGAATRSICTCVIVVIRNSVFNGKTQLIEKDKLSWPISFFWKAHTVSLIRCCINILLVECDLHNGKHLFVSLAKLGFPINYEFWIKSITQRTGVSHVYHCLQGTERKGAVWTWAQLPGAQCPGLCVVRAVVTVYWRVTTNVGRWKPLTSVLSNVCFLGLHMYVLCIIEVIIHYLYYQ